MRIMGLWKWPRYYDIAVYKKHEPLAVTQLAVAVTTVTVLFSMYCLTNSLLFNQFADSFDFAPYKLMLVNYDISATW